MQVKKMNEKIAVFQDMALEGPVSGRPALREALIAATTDPWRTDLERSAQVKEYAPGTEDVILFRRDALGEIPAVGLTLWSTDTGYYVPNIAPLEFGSLTFTQYNAILNDFIDRIAKPVANKFGFSVTTTAAYQAPDDWTSSEAAVKLRRFSGAANKSTLAGHPMDERRWFDFIVEVHRSDKKIDAGRLARWLHETDGWDETSAHELAGDFEKALALLEYYDEN